MFPEYAFSNQENCQCELLDTWRFEQLLGFHCAFADKVVHFSFLMQLACALLKWSLTAFWLRSEIVYYH